MSAAADRIAAGSPVWIAWAPCYWRAAVVVMFWQLDSLYLLDLGDFELAWVLSSRVFLCWEDAANCAGALS